MSAADELSQSRHEYLCVQDERRADDSASTASGLREGRAAAAKPLGLAETLYEGARVTGLMAAAAIDEILGNRSSPERMDEL